MDPASILGVASAAISFLDFAVKLVKGSREVYFSLDGSTEEIAHVKLIVSELQSAAATLPQGASSGDRSVYKEDQDLGKLCDKCREVCIEVLKITQDIKTDSPTKWLSSLKTALKTRWKKKDIDDMHAQLRDYRLSILLRLNKMQIENGNQANAKLDEILREFRRPIRDQHQIEASICKRIKHQLYFESIYRREEEISDPEKDTFGWITDQSKDYSVADGCEVPSKFVEDERQARCDARSEYLSWLGHGAKPTQSGAPEAAPPSPRILHISGKAGSGKSTLMRHLFQHDKTRSALETWAGAGTLVLASFYFWVASGDDMQKSLQGLYRKILHDVLHECPELAVYLFPSQWQAIQGSIDQNEEAKDSADAILFRGKAIQEAFSKLIGPAASGSHTYFFCFFIDGLDEYRERASSGGGDRKDLSPGFKNLTRELLRWNKAAHIKFCTTSRPHDEFLGPLERDGATVLRLDGLNKCDVYRYCKTTFDGDVDIAEMQLEYGDLVSEITRRAEGVFLWAVLTVQALTTSLSRGDSKDVQMKKLDAIPSELNDLYTMLLGRGEADDRHRTNEILLFALHCMDESVFFEVHWANYLDNVTDADFPLTLPRGITREEQVERGRRLVNSITHGLLIIDEFNEVQFLHRTAYDYMRERKECGQLTSERIDFDQVDVYGRFCIAGYFHWHHSKAVLASALNRADHQNRTDTYLRLADIMRREAREKYQLAHPDATAYPLLPRVAAIGVNTWDASDLPITVDDESVPTIEVSMQCYFLVLGDFEISTRVSGMLAINSTARRRFLTEEDRVTANLFSICALARDIIPLHGDEWRYYSDYLGTINLTRSFKLGSRHHPLGAYMVVCLANRCLRALVHDSDASGVVDSLQDLSDGVKKCKVTLNDSTHTVTTLEHIAEFSAMVRNGHFGHDDTPWPNLSPEEKLDRLAAYLSAGKPSAAMDDELHSELDGKLDGELMTGGMTGWLASWMAGWMTILMASWMMSWMTSWMTGWMTMNGELDGETDVDLDVGIDGDKMRDGIYLRSVEFEGYKLDSDFKIYFAVPDLSVG